MTSRRSATRRFPMRLGIYLICLLGPIGANQADAQLQTTDPYDPPGAAFRGSTYPGYVNDPSFYNRPIFRPKGGANQMENYYRSLDGGGSDLFGDFANRSEEKSRNYSNSVGRAGTAGNEADIKFFKNSQRRDSLFYEIQRERDPKKKAELMAQMKKVSQELVRDLSPGKAKGRSSGSSTPPPPIDRRSQPRVEGRSGPSVKLSISTLPAFATSRSAGRSVGEASGFPTPTRFSGEGTSRRGAAGAASSEADDDRSPSAILERSLRSEPRRGAPPIPGVDPPR